MKVNPKAVSAAHQWTTTRAKAKKGAQVTLKAVEAMVPFKGTKATSSDYQWSRTPSNPNASRVAGIALKRLPKLPKS